MTVRELAVLLAVQADVSDNQPTSRRAAEARFAAKRETVQVAYLVRAKRLLKLLGTP